MMVTLIIDLFNGAIYRALKYPRVRAPLFGTACDNLLWFIAHPLEIEWTGRTISLFLLTLELKQQPNICPSVKCVYMKHARVQGRRHKRWHWWGLAASIKPPFSVKWQASKQLAVRFSLNQVTHKPYLSSPLPRVLSGVGALWSITPISSISCTVSPFGVLGHYLNQGCIGRCCRFCFFFFVSFVFPILFFSFLESWYVGLGPVLCCRT